VGRIGFEVSFNTTVGGGGYQFINRPVTRRWQDKGAIKRLCPFKSLY
jgi:hypothetical protein